MAYVEDFCQPLSASRYHYLAKSKIATAPSPGKLNTVSSNIRYLAASADVFLKLDPANEENEERQKLTSFDYL